MKKLLYIISFMSIAFFSNAQQDYQYTQYMNNLAYINPAYTGSNGYGTFNGLFRKQWVKFDGAPSSGVITFETPFTEYNMGIGGSISYDKIGVSRQLNATVNYAYHLDFGESKLAFGLNVGINHYAANLSELTIWDETDVVFANNYSGKVIPQFGFGAYYYGEKFFAGLSIPRLTNVNTENPVNITLNETPAFNRHYYLMGGYNFDLSDDIVLKSSALIKYVHGAPVQTEISALGEYKEIYTMGISFRSKDCIAPLFQYKVKDFGKVGYAYDITITRLRAYTTGTHEIMLSYYLKGKTSDKASIE